MPVYHTISLVYSTARSDLVKEHAAGKVWMPERLLLWSYRGLKHTQCGAMHVGNRRMYTAQYKLVPVLHGLLPVSRSCVPHLLGSSMLSADVCIRRFPMWPHTVCASSLYTLAKQKSFKHPNLASSTDVPFAKSPVSSCATQGTWQCAGSLALDGSLCMFRISYSTNKCSWYGHNSIL